MHKISVTYSHPGKRENRWNDSKCEIAALEIGDLKDNPGNCDVHKRKKV